MACACAVIALALPPRMGGASALPEGSVAETDLIAPVDLAVTPVVGDRRIAAPDGQLLPAVVLLDAGVAEDAQRALDAAFVRARGVFRDALKAAFGAEVLGEEKIGSLRFRDFRTEFLAAHPEFPVGYVLAASWARGDDGEVVRTRMAGVIAGIMGRQLIGRAPEASTVFVLALPGDRLVRSWSEASASTVRAVDRADVISLEAARAGLWRNLGVGERFAGGYLETLIRENVVFDARLTALFLHERLGSRLEGRFYGRGEAVVRAGEIIDGQAAAALAQLDGLGLAPLTPVPPRERAAARPDSTVDTRVAAATGQSSAAPAVVEPGPGIIANAPPAPVHPAWGVPFGWLVATVLGGLVTWGLGCFGYMKLRRLRRAATARNAEATAGDPTLRDALAPHLAREMTRQGMHALFDQRQELLKTTEVASERMADLETRVARVQPAIQERMRGYEQRIKALERELQEK